MPKTLGFISLAILLATIPVNVALLKDDQFDCVSVPPALWSIAEDALLKRCDQKPTIAEYAAAVRNQPVRIKVLFEALCPHSQQLILGPLQRIHSQLSEKIVRIEFVPFGMAKLFEDGTIECQHGPVECSANRLLSCAIHHLEDTFPFVHCMEAMFSSSPFGVNLEAAVKQCVYQLQMPTMAYKKIAICYNGDEGDLLQQMAAQKTAAVLPDKMKFVPWLVLNNASLEAAQLAMQTNLNGMICQAYVGDEECKQQIL